MSGARKNSRARQGAVRDKACGARLCGSERAAGRRRSRVSSGPTAAGNRGLLDQIFDGSRAVKLILDPVQLRVVQGNPAAGRFYGYGTDRLRGMDLATIDRRPREEIRGDLQRAAEDSQNLFHFRHTLSSGELREVEVHSSPLSIEGRRLVYSVVRDITEKMAAEERLKKSEEEYRELVDRANAIILRIDDRGTIRFFNEYAQQFFGFTQEEILGENVIGTIVAPSESACRELSTMAGDITVHPERYGRREYENIRKDGRPVWVAWSNRAILDAHGRLVEMVCVGYDITGKKKAELNLQKANRALRTLTECDRALVQEGEESRLLERICRTIVEVGGYRLTWVGYVEHDDGKSIRPVKQVGFEEGYLEDLGITWGDTEKGRSAVGTAVRTGKPFIRRYARDDPQSAPWYDEAQARGFASAIALPLMADGVPFGVLTICADESDAFFEEEVNLLRTLADNLSYGIVAIRQRLKREESEYEARRSDQRFKMLVDVMNEGMGIQDENGIIVYANERFCGMLQYANGEVLGRALRDLLPEDRRPALEGEMEGRKRGERGVYETEMIRKDGERVPVIISATPLFDDAGRYKGSLGTILDISSRRRMEDELKEYTRKLEQSNRELEQFAFVASHDLQEPLRKISAFGGRLKEKFAGVLPADGVEYLDRMMGAAERMRRLIMALLEYSRISTRGVHLVRVSLSRVLEDVLSDLELQIERNHATVTVEDLPEIEADPDQMRQLFQNLIGNAVKYNRSEHPRVRIHGEREGDSVRIRVEDDGIGFDEKHLERIFMLFQRLHGMGEFEGTGMGLAVCRKIVERHGGAITAKSVPGKGATFIVTLPVHPPGT